MFSNVASILMATITAVIVTTYSVLVVLMFFFKIIRKPLHLLHYPWNVFVNIRVYAGKFWMGTLHAPRHDATNEPTLVIIWIPT